MKKIVWIIAATVLTSCNFQDEKADAYGNFEAVETIVSAEANGKLIFMNAEEGLLLEEGTLVALVDTSEHDLKKAQLLAQKNAVASRSEQVFSQIEVYKQQKENLIIEQKRIEKLLADGAATQRQLDDINGNIRVIERQITSVETQNASVINEMTVTDRQIEQLNEALQRCYIHNPVKGTVLAQYARPHEIVNMGKPLYKIADMDNMILRIYVSGSQLSAIQTGQKVKVFVDSASGDMTEHSGEIIWIASEAEFTPKIIQTREERVNLVYAVKIKTPNDGSLKIGMPAEVIF
ncbi:MAG: HlyD family efflux transporter periplasmic adaptor subunit [Bacteroidales bacterium]|nr:HlyD family efflux transporter periplasmic adaptor subunit [Bacteroidales bacterium]